MGGGGRGRQRFFGKTLAWISPLGGWMQSCEKKLLQSCEKHDGGCTTLHP
jgi:hypothetical protein